MNKKNIIKKAAINADLTVKEEQKAVEAFLCAVSDILKEDREVFLPDFGRFYVRKCAERQVRNPQTGEMMTVPATKRIRFKPSGSITHYTLQYGLYSGKEYEESNHADGGCRTISLVRQIE